MNHSKWKVIVLYTLYGINIANLVNIWSHMDIIMYIYIDFFFTKLIRVSLLLLFFEMLHVNNYKNLIHHHHRHHHHHHLSININIIFGIQNTKFSFFKLLENKFIIIFISIIERISNISKHEFYYYYYSLWKKIFAIQF